MSAYDMFDNPLNMISNDLMAEFDLVDRVDLDDAWAVPTFKKNEPKECFTKATGRWKERQEQKRNDASKAQKVLDAKVRAEELRVVRYLQASEKYNEHKKRVEEGRKIKERVASVCRRYELTEEDEANGFLVSPDALNQLAQEDGWEHAYEMCACLLVAVNSFRPAVEMNANNALNFMRHFSWAVHHRRLTASLFFDETVERNITLDQ